MNKALRLRLTNQDKVILEWWNLLNKKGINISKTVACAISYYAQSGRYLYLGKVYIHDVSIEPTVKKLYLQDTSTPYKWLEERMAEGEKYSSAIRRILRNSIKSSNDKDEIIPLDILIEQVENVGKIPAQGFVQTYSPVEETRFSNQESQEVLENETKVISREVSMTLEKEDLAADLMESLLGGNGLSL